MKDVAVDGQLKVFFQGSLEQILSLNQDGQWEAFFQEARSQLEQIC